VFNGSENIGLDWFQLILAAQPTVSTVSAPLPDAGPPNRGNLGAVEADDLPDNVVWAPVAQKVTIPVNGYDGFSAQMNGPFEMVGICDFSGPGPVVLNAMDKNNVLVPALAHQTVGNRASFISSPVPAGNVSFVVQNAGPAPVVVNCQVGFAPPPA
jgi:hypothetical protein